MKVRDLRRLLDEHGDEDAEVYLTTQSSWPMESALLGVVSRGELRDDIEEDPDREPPPGERWSDLLLVEGSHVRYGSRAAFFAARK